MCLFEVVAGELGEGWLSVFCADGRCAGTRQG
jgi:hypothetical protein